MTTTTIPPTLRDRPHASPPAPVGPTWLPRLVAVIGATAATLVVWALAATVADLTVHLGSGTQVQQVGPAQVGAVSLLVGLAGWGLLAMLERWSARSGTAWTVAALAVLVVSAVGPLSAGVGGATKVGLLCVHLAAAAVLIPGLARTAPRR